MIGLGNGKWACEVRQTVRRELILPQCYNVYVMSKDKACNWKIFKKHYLYIPRYGSDKNQTEDVEAVICSTGNRLEKGMDMDFQEEQACRIF